MSAKVARSYSATSSIGPGSPARSEVQTAEPCSCSRPSWRGIDKVDDALAKRTGQVLVADAPAPHAGWP